MHAGRGRVQIKGTTPVRAAKRRFGRGKWRSGVAPGVTTTVRRGAAFALVGTLALTGALAADIADPAIATVVAAGPFLAVAAVALVLPRETALFELFARPGDYRDGTLYGLAGFALAAAGTAILTVGFGMPTHVYVATILLLVFGNLIGQVLREVTEGQVLPVAGFVVGGAGAASGGQLLTETVTAATVGWPTALFLATSGALTGALLREALFRGDDALVIVSVSLLLWLLVGLPVEISTTRIAVALAVTAVLGYVSVALDTASLAGMLTGVLLGLLTVVLGDYSWFAMLITFFGVGGLSSKFRYDEKLARGVAEDNEGARGTSNVLANSLVALVAVVAAPAAPELDVTPAFFFFAFAGAVAAALADTLSSEIGGLFDNPRLVTTLEVVEPGTDGGVTWQGELIGVGGAAIIAGIALALEGITLAGGGVIVAAGVAGMTVDSLLGATVEGWLVGNKGVNFLATLAAAATGAALAATLGVTM
jgi:uncharacterized protein (TIGR00297 family)